MPFVFAIIGALLVGSAVESDPQRCVSGVVVSASGAEYNKGELRSACLYDRMQAENGPAESE